ncbi:histidine kinase [Kitasatospora sp. NBC_01287]|uniref:sensor histidine kinase n=1 Tax=Kitasatospora sp. NBC_01287 TaxID=2903573 RepID=UPI002255501B|nr:histidine kinase [Kitasatospora sp. NBC_01287]MCX4745330.1 histidine kinase [Kitasatospora sp. NBC_01287]
MLIILVPAALAVLAALLVFGGRPRSRPLGGWATGIAATASLAVTAARPAGAAGPAPGILGSLEAIALLALLVPAVRHPPIPQAVAVGLATHLAVTLWVLRAWEPKMGGTVVGGCLFWFLMATGAATGGAYLRVLDVRRVRSVAEGRLRQRLDLARDLHDFVAHDVSEIVAQAQAGLFVGESDPEVALTALRRIEEAGFRALTSMDRTVHMLHDDEDGDSRSAAHGIEELSDLVARFDASTSARVRLDLDLDRDLDLAPVTRVSREVSTTAYRVVVEALTNVRRHARDADVDIAVAVASVAAAAVDAAAADEPGAASSLTVTVRNGRSGQRSANRPNRPSRANRRGGLGLPGLAERVESIGGTLTAEPCDDGGWQVTALLPLGKSVTPAR